MNTRLAILSVTALALSAACGTPRKATAPAGTAAAAPKPSNGVYAPGEAELAAIRKSNSAVSMNMLQEGYTLYTGQTCTKCHGTKSIYSRPEKSWPGIIENMASRARLTESQKDAVLQYVLAIKAAQPK